MRTSIPPDSSRSLNASALVLARFAGRALGALLILLSVGVAVTVLFTKGALGGSPLGVLGAAAVMIALPAGLGIVLVRFCRRPVNPPQGNPISFNAVHPGSLSFPSLRPPPVAIIPPAEPSPLQALGCVLWTLFKVPFQIIYRIGIWLPIRAVSLILRLLGAFVGAIFLGRASGATNSAVYAIQPDDHGDDSFDEIREDQIFLAPAPGGTVNARTDESRRLDRIEKRQVDEVRRQAKVHEDDSRRAEQENRKRRLLEENRQRAEREAERKRLFEERQRRVKENAQRRKTFKVQFSLNNKIENTILTADTRSKALDMARQQWPGAKNIQVWTS